MQQPDGKSETAQREYTREEMREACRNNYNAALEFAAGLLKMSAATIRLHVGEMTAQEMRTVQAVLAWKAAEIRSFANGSK